ncbi:hypothetical protein J4457_07175 [Candidatus Woesearchaeota archaeon]|nr:hypothetical protein [Candidatus Woesearchaeota archaeon]
MVNSEPSENGITHVLQYEGVNVPKQELTFTEQYLSPEKINIPFQGTPGVNGRAELVVGGATYDVFIGGENENYSLTIDLNDDSVIGDGQGVNDGVGPNNASLHASPTALNDSARAVLVVHGGGIVDIGNDTPTTTFNMTVTTIASQFEEGGRNAVLGQDEIVRMEIQALPNNKLDLNVYGITFRRYNQKPDTNQARAVYGNNFLISNVGDEGSNLQMEYPLHQIYYQVFITGNDAKIEKITRES